MRRVSGAARGRRIVGDFEVGEIFVISNSHTGVSLSGPSAPYFRPTPRRVWEFYRPGQIVLLNWGDALNRDSILIHGVVAVEIKDVKVTREEASVRFDSGGLLDDEPIRPNDPRRRQFVTVSDAKALKRAKERNPWIGSIAHDASSGMRDYMTIGFFDSDRPVKASGTKPSAPLFSAHYP